MGGKKKRKAKDKKEKEKEKVGGNKIVLVSIRFVGKHFSYKKKAVLSLRSHL